MKFQETPPPIDTSKLERIAFASSEDREHQIRWTELALYYRPGERRPFVAESVGRTKVAGEVDFTRQRVAKTIEEGLRLFDNSRLADQIVGQAQAWLDSNQDAATKPKPPKAPVIQFNGARGLRGALEWLYPVTTPETSDLHLAKLFEYDWGVPNRTVRHALQQERDGTDPTPWVKAFIGALQHFDRDAFHASKRPGA